MPPTDPVLDHQQAVRDYLEILQTHNAALTARIKALQKELQDEKRAHAHWRAQTMRYRQQKKTFIQEGEAP